MKTNSFYAKKIRQIIISLIFVVNIANIAKINAQTTVQLGSGTDVSGHMPIRAYYGYSYTQSIYEKSTLVAAGIPTVGVNISKIAFRPSKDQDYYTNSNEWVVYIGSTAKTSFSSNSDWIGLNNLTKVSEGNLPSSFSAGDWIELQFTTPFFWDGNSNIVIAVDENKASYNSSESGFYAYKPVFDGPMIGLCAYSDSNNPNPASPPNANDQTDLIPQIKLTFESTQTCSGTPTAGTAVLTPNMGGVESTVNGSVTGATSDMGLTYQWQYSDNGSTWIDIAGATSANLSTTAKSELGTRQYRRKISCGTNSAFSDPATYTTQLEYCVPSYSNGCSGDNITSVLLDNMSVTGLTCDPIYADISSTQGNTPNLTAGIAYEVKVGVGNGGTEHVTLWIDFNQDGDFEDDGERFYIGNGKNITITENITIPHTALSGTTKMRVRSNYNSQLTDPCASGSYGSARDFTVNIINSSCPSPTAVDITDINIAAGTATAIWTAPPTAPSEGYQWEVRTSGEAGSGASGRTTYGTAGSAATSANITSLTADTDYTFYIRANCGGGDFSNWVSKSFKTGYCTPSTSSGSNNDHVSNFTTTNAASNFTDNVADAGPNGYRDHYNSYSLKIGAGESFNFSATGKGNNVTLSIWIDWNQDYAFTNSSPERVFTQYKTGQDPNFSGAISVPAEVANGEYRMRVRVEGGTSPINDPCEDIAWGEARDYKLVVASACYQPLISTASNITNNSANLNWLAPTVGNPAQYEVQWSTSSTFPSGSTSSATVSTSTKHSITGLINNTTYYYQVRSKCAEGDFSEWTNAESFTTGAYTPIEVSGFNQDVIASGNTPASQGTSAKLDNDGHVLVTEGYYLGNDNRPRLPLNRVLHNGTHGNATPTDI